MPNLSTVFLFVAVTAALFVIPGPSVIYIVTRSVTQGRAAGLISVLGMHVGTIPYMLATSLGLSALLASPSLTIFRIIKYLGATYLIWLGIQKLWLLRKSDESVAEPTSVSSLRIFSQAVLVSILNPKTFIFFVAFVPQFVNPARGSITFQVVFFCVGFLLLGITSDATYAVFSSALAARLHRTAASRRRLDHASGIVYLLLGAFVALISGT